MVRTPNLDDPVVKSFCESVCQGAALRYVQYVPVPEAPLRECFRVVNHCVSAHGGRAVLGWNIVELPGIWLEAEFHAVWQRPDNALLDVSPREFPLARYLFVEDKNLPYNGAQVASQFQALTSHPAVHRHIEVAREFFVETNRPENSDEHTYANTPRIIQLQAEMEALLAQFPW